MGLQPTTIIFGHYGIILECKLTLKLSNISCLVIENKDQLEHTLWLIKQ